MATRNIVPRANGEGNIGTALKNWLKGWFQDVFVSGNITDGSNNASVANIKDAVDKKHAPESDNQTADTVPTSESGVSVQDKLDSLESAGGGLTGNVTYYVATTGSDITGDGSSGNPFATIQHAIDLFPKNLNGYTAHISIANGTYTEFIDILNFYGGGILSFGCGASVTWNCPVASTYLISAKNCAVELIIQSGNMILTQDYKYIFQFENCSNIKIWYAGFGQLDTYTSNNIVWSEQSNVNFMISEISGANKINNLIGKAQNSFINFDNDWTVYAEAVGVDNILNSMVKAYDLIYTYGEFPVEAFTDNWALVNKLYVDEHPLKDYTTISSPVEGQIAWNYETHKQVIFNGSEWETVSSSS